jgi:hypothetical protein
MTETTRTEPYPPILRQEIRRASRLSHALSLLATRVGPNDSSFEWICVRIDEVRVQVGEVTRDWSESRLDGAVAAGRLRDYLRTLEESLHAFSRSSFVRGGDDATPATGAEVSGLPATSTRRASP